MIRAIAALALLTASSVTLATTTKTAPASASDALVSSTPWWERITVTIAGDGQSHSCRFESSLDPNGAKACDVVGSEAAAMPGGSGAKDQYTRISFERRFTPGAQPASGDLQLGDTLLGRQVMVLAIDAGGAVKGCKILAASGVMTPDYGCKEASAERFQASAAKASDSAREGTMTILVYGHAEHVV